KEVVGPLHDLAVLHEEHAAGDVKIVDGPAVDRPRLFRNVVALIDDNRPERHGLEHLEVNPAPVRHDALDAFGYRIPTGDGRSRLARAIDALLGQERRSLRDIALREAFAELRDDPGVHLLRLFRAVHLCSGAPRQAQADRTQTTDRKKGPPGDGIIDRAHEHLHSIVTACFGSPGTPPPVDSCLQTLSSRPTALFGTNSSVGNLSLSSTR